MYWDSHCHLSDERWGDELEVALLEAKARGIGGFVMGGYEPDEWERQRQLVRRFPACSLVPCFGLHPLWVSEATEEQINEGLDRLAREISSAKAIGEMGLDGRPPFVKGWEKQTEAFRAQLELAGFVQKPIVLHVVRAHREVLSILTLHREFIRAGFVHAFHGDIDVARQYLDHGLALSIGGAITHPRAENLREVARWLPQDRLLVETDSPDQKVRNWPSALHRPVALWNIAEVIADLRKQSVEEVLQISAENIGRILEL